MQGVSEAKAAEAASNGIGAPVIYKDIENYSPASVLSNGASCGSVVNSYLDSWDKQLQADLYTAGAYGNPTPVANWWANVSPLPNDVWIAQANNQVTIWNVGTKYGMTDSMWPSSQRMHQYTGTHTENWGPAGSPSFGIDSDIVNAQIVSNAGVKSYSYPSTSYSTINCAGSVSTLPAAINDMNGSALISGPGQMGTVVGSYTDSNDVVHGYVQPAGAACALIDYPGAYATYAAGIDNAGDVVGYWQATDESYDSGFAKIGANAPQVLNYPGATATRLLGINDAGQIVGQALLSGAYQDFMYYKGAFYSVANGDGDSAYKLGINGSAVITGPYANGGYFDESMSPSSNGTWSGTPILFPPNANYYLDAFGLDDNIDIVGDYNGDCGFTMPQNATTPTVLCYPSADYTDVFGTNDFGQLVGDYEINLADSAMVITPAQQ
jgi:hypothetical protein